MNEQQIGYRDTAAPPSSDLRRLLMNTPTGANLLAGSDVEYVFDADPTGTVGSWPDGARGIWPDGLGNIMIGRYLRSTGWCSVQAIP